VQWIPVYVELLGFKDNYKSRVLSGTSSFSTNKGWKHLYGLVQSRFRCLHSWFHRNWIIVSKEREERWGALRWKIHTDLNPDYTFRWSPIKGGDYEGFDLIWSTRRRMWTTCLDKSASIKEGVIEGGNSSIDIAFRAPQLTPLAVSLSYSLPTAKRFPKSLSASGRQLDKFYELHHYNFLDLLIILK
jgi:hypothetical protein